VPFRFDNYARHVGSRGDNQWYEWRIFMAEPPDTLATVSYVEYRLHETFPDPFRTSYDAESRFAIESSGWGEFMIPISVSLQDGKFEQTEYMLDLSKPWPADAVPGES